MTRVTTRNTFPATMQAPPAEPPLSMAEWQARDRSDRRFRIGVRVYFVLITVAAVSSAWWLH